MEKKPELGGLDDEAIAAVEGGVEINAAGHRDQLKRQYNLVGLAGIALTVDNAWAALGSSISISIGKQNLISTDNEKPNDIMTLQGLKLIPFVANGGPTGLIFGLIVAVFYYSFIGLSLAEV